MPMPHNDHPTLSGYLKEIQEKRKFEIEGKIVAMNIQKHYAFSFYLCMIVCLGVKRGISSLCFAIFRLRFTDLVGK